VASNLGPLEAKGRFVGLRTKKASSTDPTLPAPTTGATSRNLRVVVAHERGLGVVEVLGPFLDKMTSSQFHLSWVCGLAKAIEAKNTTTR
jgi:hypothetical protein